MRMIMTMASFRPLPPISDLGSLRARRAARLFACLALAGAACLSGNSAEARCISSGVIYSCVTNGGPPVLLSCFGTGAVQTCIDASGKSVIVGHHWRRQFTSSDDPSSDGTADNSTQMQTVDETSFEAELSSALAANAAAAKSTAKPTSTRRQPTAR
jgi:hypothetical protein